MRLISFFLLLWVPLLFGCSTGGKISDLSYVYGTTMLLSLFLLFLCCRLMKKKHPWFLVLFTSVLVVNIGYYFLSVSPSLDVALWANRIAYLGSVFLPMSMFLIIYEVAGQKISQKLIGILLGVAVLMFAITASPGWLPIYYKDVSLQQVDGVTTLSKVYGPLHILYLIYLVGYFAAMLVTIACATLRAGLESRAYAVILALAVLVNIGVWLLEQLVHIDFEILSVSYLISESFLLGLHLFMDELRRKDTPPLSLEEPPTPAPAVPADADTDPQLKEQYLAGISRLTPKERALYDCYVEGLTTAQIMEQLNIKENTLKFHNKNLYGKLGVSSRRQLMDIHRKLF